MITYSVVINEDVKNDLIKVPPYIAVKLYEWVEAVIHDGLLEVRKIKGYHDEPLKGHRKGQRSIRLSRSYRAIYVQSKDGIMKLIEIIGVNKHDYS